MKTSVWIGVDVGTTGVRAVAYQADGKSLCAYSETYPLAVPRPGWAEQNPDEIVDKTRRVIAEAGAALREMGYFPSGVALSTVFHSFLGLDDKRRPLTPLIIWADGRGSDIAASMRSDAALCRDFYRRSGCPVHSSFPLAKIIWLRDNQPELFRRMRFVGSIKDYLFERLTDEWLVDRSIASGSGMYNAETLEWDRQILDYAGLSQNQLPPVASTTCQRPLSSRAAAEVGLTRDLPVVVGAGDGVLANLGIGAVKPGQVGATIGTSGAVRMLVKRPITDALQRTWCYNLTDDCWVAGGAINNGGIALKWVRDQLCGYADWQAASSQANEYDRMTSAAGEIAAGSDGLILLPFFSGERAPHWNSDLRAAFFGLSLMHTRAHMIRAVLEGVSYSMNSILAALKATAGEIKDVRVSGSFTKSPVWLQILSDVFNEEIHVPSVEEGAAFGAAVLGFISEGTIKNVAATADIIHVEKIYRPKAQNATAYRQLYGIYEDLYRVLEPQFKKIVEYQKNI